MSENRLARIESYSDGVFAIASTLLILEIKVPSVGAGAPLSELWRGLADLWPSYLAFVTSFVTILVMWVAHHNAIRDLTKASNSFLYANGFLLLTVTFIPFPTALLARYVGTDYASVAVVFYAFSNLLNSAAFLVWFAAMQKPVYLFKPELGKGQIRKVWAQISTGALGYIVAAILGWWRPLIVLGLMIAIAVLWGVVSVEERRSTSLAQADEKVSG